MKKLFYNCKAISAAFTLCLAAIITTSCSQDLEEGKVQTDNNPAALNVVKLNFATSALTRGTMYDDIKNMPDDATFGVYGYGHKDGETTPNEPNFINNGSAKKDGEVRVKGEVATYKANMPNVQFAAVYPQLNNDNKFTKTGANTYTFTYSLQGDMAQQKDLMIGQADEFKIDTNNSTDKKITSKNTITMHHALTAINFAIGDRVPTGYTIERIYLKGLYTKGTCTVNLSKATKPEQRFTWSDLSDKGTIGIKLHDVSTTQINRTPFTGLKDGKGKYDNFTVFMIPQKLDDKAVAEVYLKRSQPQDYGAKARKITIPLKENTIYNAGEVKKYNLSAPQESKILTDVKLFDPKTRKKGKVNSAAITFGKDKDKCNNCEKVEEKSETFKIYIDSYRYAFKTVKNPTSKFPEEIPAIKAPQRFKIEKIEYGTKYNKWINKIPNGWCSYDEAPQYEEKRDLFTFNLTFNRKNIINDPTLKKDKYFAKRKTLHIKIIITVDGAKDKDPKVEIKGKYKLE